MTPGEILRAGLIELDLPLTERQHDQLLTYLSELEMWNPTHGLVNASGAELVTRHLLDCAAGAAVFRRELHDGAVVIDAGSGAGLPGIPLAVLLPELRFLLVERSARRVGFLRNAIATCRIENVTAVEDQVGRVDVGADAVTCRAFHPLTRDTYTELGRSLTEAGLIVLYKGSLRRLTEETRRLPEEAIISVEPLLVPGLEEERHLVLLRPHRDGRG